MDKAHNRETISSAKKDPSQLFFELFRKTKAGSVSRKKGDMTFTSN